MRNRPTNRKNRKQLKNEISCLHWQIRAEKFVRSIDAIKEMHLKSTILRQEAIIKVKSENNKMLTEFISVEQHSKKILLESKQKEIDILKKWSIFLFVITLIQSLILLFL